MDLSERARPYPMTPDMGTVVGQHDGAHFFTVGQRKGLQVGGKPEPLFVLGTCIETNTVFVGQGDHHPGLYRTALRLGSAALGSSPLSKRLHRAKRRLGFASATDSHCKQERSCATRKVSGSWISRTLNEGWLQDNLPPGMAGTTAQKSSDPPSSQRDPGICVETEASVLGFESGQDAVVGALGIGA